MLLCVGRADGRGSFSTRDAIIFLPVLRQCVAGRCGGRLSQASAAEGSRRPRRIEPIYDKVSGRLQLLKYDANGDGLVETFSYMDGNRVVRIELDANDDGRIDRWEYYGAGRRLERVGFSRAGDGREDSWSFPDAAGAVARIESSTNRDGRVDRIEHFEGVALARVEEDTDADGAIDQWTTYDQGRLTRVAFDPGPLARQHRPLSTRADGPVECDARQAALIVGRPLVNRTIGVRIFLDASQSHTLEVLDSLDATSRGSWTMDFVRPHPLHQEKTKLSSPAIAGARKPTRSNRRPAP